MTGVTDELLTETAADVIRALAGPDALVRDDQLAAARALVVERRRALVVQATGWGKSAVYWIAAAATRRAGGGPTLILSPLLALMGDQVAAAQRAGLRAVTMNSANFEDWPRVEELILADEVDVLLVSPERLANPRFTSSILTPLLPRLGLLVIDEAHCISSWGHDFRPDYQRIARLLTANPDLPVLGTTATANARVTTDVAAQLGDDTYVQRGRLARETLHLGVVDGLSTLGRFAWVETALRKVPGSGIVYCLTVADTESLANYLASQGHLVAAYHGSVETDRRAEIEKALLANELKAVVATSALGMGYDKPDLAFCLHVGSPPSPVDYYQQIGRAGRALDQAVVVLLPAANDERLWDWFATASVPDPDHARAMLDALGPSPLSTQVLTAATGLRLSEVELLVKILAVDGAADRVEGGYVATGRSWAYDAAKYEAVVAARRAEADLMRAYARGRECLEVILRRALDDEVAAGERCGRCSVCLGTLPVGLRPDLDPQAMEAARESLRGQEVPLEPRKMFTAGIAAASGRPEWKGKIPAELAGGVGRALGRADDPAWEGLGEVVTGPDGPAPEWLLAGMRAKVRRLTQRISAVVPVPSASHPILVTSLAAACAEELGVDVLDLLESHAPAPEPDLPAAVRARALASRLGLRVDAHVPEGALLLVDDVWRTGWTATFAAAVLREAGAAAVIPLVAQRLM